MPKINALLADCPEGVYSGPLSQDTNFPNLRYSLLCVAYCFNPAYSVAARGGYSGPLSQDTNFPNLRYSLLCVAYCFNPAYSVAARGGPVVKRWTTSLFVHRLTTGPQVSRRPAGRGHKYTGCPSSHQFQRWDTVVHFCWRHPMETLVRPLVVVQLSNSTPIIPKHDQSAILGIPGTIRRSELVNENETLMTLI